MQIETLKIQNTAQPEEQLTQQQWLQQYFVGARLKPEIQPFMKCPMETYLKFIDNTINSQNN